MEMSATLIDHIWTNNISNTVNSGIFYCNISNTVNHGFFYCNISDHFPIYATFEIDSPYKVSNRKTIYYRDYAECHILGFKNHLMNVCWDLVKAASNPNVAYLLYFTFIYLFIYLTLPPFFMPSFERFFPLKAKTMKLKSFNKPYITNEKKKKKIRDKNNLQKKFAKWPITYGDQFRTARNRLNCIIRDAKRNYYSKRRKQK